MQSAIEPPPSPTSSPERPDNGVPIQKTTSRGSASGRESMSLKRGRERSLEPYPAEARHQIPAVTKKNRLAEATASEKSKTPDPNDVEVDETEPGPNDSKPVEGEGGNVGEVRRKVEKLTHEEGAGGEVGGPDEAAPNGDDGGKEVVIENPSGDHQMDKADAGNDSGEWVEIDKSEVEADVPVEGDGLKRKNLERSESSFVQGAGEIEGAGVKRQKDTPSPKPDALSKPEEPPKKPQTSFSAFATTASPFAAVRSAAPFATAPTSTSTPTKPSPSPFATSGFGSYSSTFSPFGSKKAAPPPNAFDKDGGKDKDEEAEAGPSKSTFGDILTSGKHVEEEDEGEEQKRHMTEQEVATGEEDEETLCQTRAKLYVMQADGGWKERGTGTLKLNVRRSDGRGARLVMRAEGVLRLILNVSLYAGMACLEDGKYVRTTVFENNERRFITFRTASNKTAMELSGAVIDAIPLETGASVEASRSPEPRALSDDAGGKSLSQQDGEEGQGDEGVERVADGDDEAV